MKVDIYTDGACSKNPGIGGWGSIFVTGKKVLKISGGDKNTTNNKMELKAVVESLKMIRKIEEKRKHHYSYVIHSDSAYVVNAKEKNWLLVWQMNGWKNSKGDDVKNRDLWEEFLDNFTYLIRHHIDVELHKVKGHSGIKFNEEVDALARKEVQKLTEK